VVLVKEDDIPLHWKLGKVIRIHPETDGNMRMVTLQTSNGQFTRSVRKICPPPFEGNPREKLIIMKTKSAIIQCCPVYRRFSTFFFFIQFNKFNIFREHIILLGTPLNKFIYI